MSRLLAVLAAASCATSTPSPSVTPSPTPTPSAAPAPAPAPAAGADAGGPVGPDGPDDLAVPTFTVDPAQTERGKAVFDAKGCGACHQFGSKLVGPDLNGVGERRSATWIARMIRHPGAMVKRDPTAKQLFREAMVEMTDQGVADDEVGPLVSFLVSHPATH